jgi:hypothetical protein
MVGLEVNRAWGGVGPRCWIFLLRKKGKME